jgi:hypothetical protein
VPHTQHRRPRDDRRLGGEADAGHILGEHAISGGVEAGGEGRLPEVAGGGEQDRLAPDVHGRGMEREVAATKEAEHRRDSPQPLLPAHGALAAGGKSHARSVGIDGEGAVSLHPEQIARSVGVEARPEPAVRNRRPLGH